jgi:hypothetical protein
MLRDGRAGSRGGEDVMGVKSSRLPLVQGVMTTAVCTLETTPPPPLVIRISDLRQEQSVNY